MVPPSTHPNPTSATSSPAGPRFHLAQALWMAGFWVLMTVAMTLQFWLRRREDLTEALLFSAVQWLPWALFTPVLFWLSEHFTLEKGRWQRTVWVHLGASLVMIVVMGLISYGLEPPPPIGPPPGGRPGPPPGRPGGAEGPFRGPPPGERRGPPRGPPDVTELILRRAMFQLPVCWAVVGVAHAFVFYRRAADRERQAAELESRLAVARLQALRMQLNPHFLFNTLNSVASLVHEDPRKADEMIGSLSELLRQTLGAADRQEATLREELSLLDRYLAIERVRFGDRLRVETRIDPQALDALVPILILQPLVENAIKHGIEEQLGPGVVCVAARREGESLLLEVADNGRGLDLQGDRPLKEGVGLSNTRSRIEALGAGVGSLQLRSPATGGLVAEVRLPWRPTADPNTRKPSTI